MLTPAAHGLEYFLSPLSEEAFFADCFDRRWVHVPAGERAKSNMFPVDALEEELRRRRPWDQKRDGAPTYLRLLRDGRVGKPVTSLNEVIAGCHEGMSLVLNSVHETVTEIAEACEVLERAFGVAASANVYFSPPRSQGFDVHVEALGSRRAEVDVGRRRHPEGPLEHLARLGDLGHRLVHRVEHQAHALVAARDHLVERRDRLADAPVAEQAQVGRGAVSLLVPGSPPSQLLLQRVDRKHV